MTATIDIAHVVGLTIALLMVAVATSALSRWLRLPFTILLVLVGVAGSHLLQWQPERFAALAHAQLSPQLILFVFLPTLVFASAYTLDVRRVRENWVPILGLAAPGLLLSTALIGLILWLAVGIDLNAALLLGAILSATDPVAVVALFRKLGAPERLLVLVEGESLFNDATSIVLATILAGTLASGELGGGLVLSGAVDFVVVFVGGALVGWLLALVAGFALGRVRNDMYVEITLSTILAYLSFLVAEEAFHVSGVMAVAAAGMTLGSDQGRIKISKDVRAYMDNFWEYLAFVANSLIFLLVGFLVDLGELAEVWSWLLWVIVAMLVSRAAVVHGLLPLLARLPGVNPVGARYRQVMFWGGLRGAIALAMVMSLPEFAHRDAFIALVTGAVLFTLVVQGLSMEALVRRLGLDRPTLPNRLALIEGQIAAGRRAESRIPLLQRSGFFSARIAEQMRRRYRRELAGHTGERQALELSPAQEQRLAALSQLAFEKQQYLWGASQGLISEAAYVDLVAQAAREFDALRHDLPRPAPLDRAPWEQWLSHQLHSLGAGLPLIGGWLQSWRLREIALDYERAWARQRAATEVLERITADELPAGDGGAHYREMRAGNDRQLEQIAGQFPEFVAAMQERLAERLLIHGELETVHERRADGSLPAGMAEALEQQLAERLDTLGGQALEELRLDPLTLLRHVPLFEGMPESEFRHLVERLRPYNEPAGSTIIRQGEHGRSLYLIARGVLRVSRREGEQERELAKLFAGDFVGEMALLHDEPRAADVNTLSPCALYELTREDFEAICAAQPQIAERVREIDQQRKQASQAAPE